MSIHYKCPLFNNIEDCAFLKLSQFPCLTSHTVKHVVTSGESHAYNTKKKNKQIVNQLRSCAGCKLEEELEVPSDFLFFDYMDAVIGSRASVTPVHLLDSADTPGSSPSSRTSTPVPLEESRTSTPDPFVGLSPAQSEMSGPTNHPRGHLRPFTEMLTAL